MHDELQRDEAVWLRDTGVKDLLAVVYDGSSIAPIFFAIIGPIERAGTVLVIDEVEGCTPSAFGFMVVVITPIRNIVQAHVVQIIMKQLGHLWSQVVVGNVGNDCVAIHPPSMGTADEDATRKKKRASPWILLTQIISWP